MTLDYRYQALDFSGKVLATGKRIMDIEGVGQRILIDNKLLKHATTDYYPAYRYSWITGIRKVGNIIRREI